MMMRMQPLTLQRVRSFSGVSGGGGGGGHWIIFQSATNITNHLFDKRASWDDEAKQKQQCLLFTVMGMKGKLQTMYAYFWEGKGFALYKYAPQFLCP